MATVKAVAVIAGDKNIKGSLHFIQDSTGYTHVKGSISGLTPGLHGFHIHALGDTTNGCISTGPHFNPLKKNHGAPTDSERHAGDLGNIFAGPDGVAEISIRDSNIPLTGQNSILGRAVVVHADPDDLGRGGHELSKTTGNAGGRNKFIFWYTRQTPGMRTHTSYEDNIKKIVDFSTVEGFWACYCHLARPTTLPVPTDLHLFKEGIRPLWEAEIMSFAYTFGFCKFQWR